VIVRINGPFGVGKSTVATRLRAAIPNARIFDPEDIGWIVGRLPGQGLRDYQDRRLWRWITREIARKLARGRIRERGTDGSWAERQLERCLPTLEIGSFRGSHPDRRARCRRGR
jgi:hypothetical protein